MNRVESLSREIERDTLFLDQTSQFAVDAFNRKVKRCNLLIQQAKAEDRRVNQMVDDYNERLRHLDR